MAGACGGSFMLFMAILESFINGRCDLADPCNRVSSATPDSLLDSYDFIVAGAVLQGQLWQLGCRKILNGRYELTKHFQVFICITWPVVRILLKQKCRKSRGSDFDGTTQLLLVARVCNLLGLLATRMS